MHDTNGCRRIVAAVNRSIRPCESMHGNARTFLEQVIASIIGDSRCGMSADAFRSRIALSCYNISETSTASIFKIYQFVALDSICISAGNDIIISFRSTANRINVFILGHVRVAISQKWFNRFQKGLQFWNRLFKQFFIFDCWLHDSENGAEVGVPSSTNYMNG